MKTNNSTRCELPHLLKLHGPGGRNRHCGKFLPILSLWYSRPALSRLRVFYYLHRK